MTPVLAPGDPQSQHADQPEKYHIVFEPYPLGSGCTAAISVYDPPQLSCLLARRILYIGKDELPGEESDKTYDLRHIEARRLRATME